MWKTVNDLLRIFYSHRSFPCLSLPSPLWRRMHWLPVRWLIKYCHTSSSSSWINRSPIMCDTLQAGRRSAFLWLILAVTTLSLQVIGVTAHHHSAAQHAEQRRLHQQHESFGEGHHHRKPEINKSSKMWLINSYPDTQPMSNGWAFREWHNHLMTSYAPPTTTTTTTTTTPRTILSARTPFPSLWNYAPKKGTVQQSHSNSSGNRTATRGLSPKHGWVRQTVWPNSPN